MRIGFSQQEIIETAQVLGLPTDGFIQRRVARAYDLVESNKVSQIDDGIFRVRSQYDASKAYIVNVNHGQPSCDCPDGERTVNCKHRIASLLYARKQAAAITIVKTTDGEDGDFWRRCWLITQGNRRIVVYEEHDGRLFCNCGAYYQDCEHKQLVIKTVTNELKAIALEESTTGNFGFAVIPFRPLKEKPVVNECGSNEAKALQDQMNGQIDSQNDNGNGAKAPSQPTKLDLRDPFQQSEQLDIDQIEGRLNGELAHSLSNGEVVISYKGIMTLSEKHHITFEALTHDDTNTVIAKGRCGTSERVSGKPINGSVETAIELAKRNAARQLLPLAEIKAIEYKAKLANEFSWQKAYEKCAQVAGGKAQVDIIINDLVNWGKLRQDNPSGYNRTEWLLIHEYCQKEASIERDPGSTNNWSYNSAVFIERCREAIEQVRAEDVGLSPDRRFVNSDNHTITTKSIEANELPMVICGDKPACTQNGNGKRKLQMDKKLRTWLVESDLTSTEISCREICEQFSDGSIVTRLRAGIDSGADISTVELDD